MIIDISWIKPEQLIEFELIQLKDEGVDSSSINEKWNTIKSNSKPHIRKEAELLLDELEYYKKIDNKQIVNFLDSIRQRDQQFTINFEDEEIYDKILGGWNGRAAGCLLGKPVEKYSRQIIREILTSNNTYPLDNYITDKGIPDSILKQYPWNRHSGAESLRDNIVCMTEDDDMNYAMLNLYILEKYGLEFTTFNVAEEWLSTLPVLSTFTAERVAYFNLLQLLELEKVPVFRNPYREWIGAMIRADVWGWVSPGNPLQAAELAFKDASLSHIRDGVYAEMFVAALLAICFSTETPEQALSLALHYIPEESRTYKAVAFGMEAANKHHSWDSVLDELHRDYKEYHWVHSVNNMALIAAALVFGKGDFEKSITGTVMGGLDTDSSGATVGAVIGTLNGFNKLPSKWITPLKDQIRSSLKGFDNSRFSELASRTTKLALKHYRRKDEVKR